MKIIVVIIIVIIIIKLFIVKKYYLKEKLTNKYDRDITNCKYKSNLNKKKKNNKPKRFWDYFKIINLNLNNTQDCKYRLRNVKNIKYSNKYLKKKLNSKNFNSKNLSLDEYSKDSFGFLLNDSYIINYLIS